MAEIHLKQAGLTYSACGTFTKNKERIQKLMQAGNTDYIYKNDLGKACFQHDMAYGKYKDLVKRTQSGKGLRDKAFKIASNPNYDEYKKDQLQWFTFFLDKKTADSGVATLPNKSMSNQLQLANKYMPNKLQLSSQLTKPVIRELKRSRVYSSFKDNIWGVDSADMQLTRKYNKGIYQIFMCH